MASLFCSAACLLVLLHTALSAYAPHSVTHLPGQPTVLFKQYAGQLVLNGTDKAFFYWFYEADRGNSSSLPLVLWLSGGPGCSSVGAGALSELGPFRTNNSGTGLSLNPHAWNKVSNMIFLESPYGVGFSYKNSTPNEGLNDEQTASDTLAFLLQWFSVFPEYSRNEFFITGESYAGHYIPILASLIITTNRRQGYPVNLKGFAIGNPWTAETYDDPGNLEFLYSHSIISADLYKQAKAYCYSSYKASRCSVAQNLIGIMTAEINMYNVYEPNCNTQVSKKRKRHKEVLAGAYNPCLDSVTPYMNLRGVQAALNVVTRPISWAECSDAVNAMYSEDDVAASILSVYPRLFRSKLRIWIYSGDIDGVVSTISTKSWLQRLNLTVQRSWYPWNYKDQVGGWTEVYNELTFTTIRNSGHMAPTDKPGPSLSMFEHFLKNAHLPAF